MAIDTTTGEEGTMASNDGNGGVGLLMAFLLGAVTGAAAALLLAPAAGRDTRQYLGEKARQGRDKAAEAARQTKEVLDRQRDTVMSAVERGREAYREARQKENA
jgi:gas vesicle protein